MPVNEWGFAAEIKSWWDAAFREHPDLGFDRCTVEEQVDVGYGATLKTL